MTVTTPAGALADAGQPHVTVLTDRCAGCQECVIRCPAAALSMDAGRWVAVADDTHCVGCRQCERTCPFGAIAVDGPLVVPLRTTPSPASPDGCPGGQPVSGPPAAGPAVTDLPAGTVSEVRQGFASWEEALAEASRCLDCPDPTCIRGCPAHNDIPSFIRAIRDRDLGRAHDVLHLTSFLPDVCSRVCDQAAQCEGACTWSLAGGEPVAIGKLERFVTDHSPVPPPQRASGEGAGLSVAVVGSGPAGIGAAWRLVEAGAAVTVYERDTVPGGLVNWGIPDFTLPAPVAARPWQQLIAAGVNLRCGRPIDPAGIGDLLADHDSVILANGAPVPLRLPVPGADLDGVTDATRFLKAGKAALAGGDTAQFRRSFGLPASPRDAGAPASPRDASHDAPPRVLVLGAGNSAMDVARTARRLGLAAVCVDWADERFALARPDELQEARSEGVEIRFLRTVARLEGTFGRVRRAVLAPTRQNRADRPPAPVRKDPETLAVDLVVMAMGYRNDPAFAALLPGTPLPREATGLPSRRWLASGILAAQPPSQRTPVGRLALAREARLAASALPFQERVWAAGDAIAGPSTVVEAMAEGRRAAASLLAARPTRGAVRPPRRVVVAYESRGGRTARAARLIADELRETGAVVRAVPAAEIDITDLAAADLLVIGTWVEGFVVGGVKPARPTRDWMASLPRLPGLRTATFCTFAVSPRQTLPVMRRMLEDRGMTVLAEGAFGPRGRTIAEGAASFAARLLVLAWPGRRSHPSR